MKDLSRHIEYLLCEHDSVAIPGIGTFIIKELPARYYTEECSYLPPIRSVYLDTAKKHDDGKLENCLIQLHRVTRNVAQKWITDYVDGINQSFMEIGTMEVGTIGRMIFNDGEITFEVCDAGVNSPELYGLDSFIMPKLPAYAHKGKVAKDPTHFTIRLRRTTVHRIMTAAAMIIVAFTIIMPNYSSFNFNEQLQAKMASAESLFTLFDTTQPVECPIENKAEDIITITPDVVEVKETIEEVNAPATDLPQTSSNTIVCDMVPLKEAEILNNVSVQEVEIKEEVAVTEIAPTLEVIPTPVITTTQTQITETEPSEQAVLEAKGYCVVMASAITQKGANVLIKKLNKEGIYNAVKHIDNGMLRVVLTGYENEKDARTDLAVVRTIDKLYSGSWIKYF